MREKFALVYLIATNGAPSSQLGSLFVLREEMVKVKPSILYFDDEAVLLKIFQEMFSDEYEVLTASTLAEASKIISACRPSIIISDWSMPEISGVEFLRNAAELCPDSFRIMLTGFAQLGDMIGEVAAGTIQLFISKPWKEEQMRCSLERAALTHPRK